MKKKTVRPKTRRKPAAPAKKRPAPSLMELLAASEEIRSHLFAAGQELLSALDAAACIIKGVAKRNAIVKEYPAVPQAIQMVACNIQQLLKKF